MNYRYGTYGYALMPTACAVPPYSRATAGAAWRAKVTDGGRGGSLSIMGSRIFLNGVELWCDQSGSTVDASKPRTSGYNYETASIARKKTRL